MHRSIFLILLLFALAGCSRAPSRPAASPAPTPEPVTTPAPPAAISMPFPGAPETAPSPEGVVGLLLPLDVPAIAAEAGAVQRGFLVAREMDPVPLAVETYPTGASGAQAIQAYQRAVGEGASIIVGPLARSSVTAIENLAEFPVPTLLLNLPDEPRLKQGLYYFPGVSVTREAQEVAALARTAGHRQAVIVHADTSLARRAAAALAADWRRGGGALLGEVSFSADVPDARTMREGFAALGQPDVLFLLADGRRSGLVLRDLPTGVPIYSTSQVYSERQADANRVLEGLIFVDMPWLVDFTNPQVLTYPRSREALSVERDRLYALGIDAYRLAKAMVLGLSGAGYGMSGVTGQVSLEQGNVFERIALPVYFRQGYPAMLDGSPRQ